MTIATAQRPTAEELDALVGARLHDPFRVLGLHRMHGDWSLRVFRPYSQTVELRLETGFTPMRRVHPQGVFEWQGAEAPPQPVVLRASEAGRELEICEPYTFAPAIGADDLYLFNEGRLEQAYRVLGSHPEMREGVQ